MSESDLMVKNVTSATKPYLADTIDYDTDIDPYQFIQIFSGVGSGKNTLVDFLIAGGKFKHRDGTPVKKQNILLLTSRRAKVDETLKHGIVTYNPYIGMLDDLSSNWYCDDEDAWCRAMAAPEIILPDLDGMGTVAVKCESCVNTNAKIAKFQQNYFMPNYAPTHPWLRFDMIIVDEVHAVLSDATYQDSVFYVRRLIEETLKNSTDCKVIVMTGTPDILKLSPVFTQAHTINRMQQCVSVRPKMVHFITQAEAYEMQRSMLKRRKKFIAFYNHIDAMLKFEEAADEDSKSGIVVAFSDEKRIADMKNTADPRLERMENTQLYLANNQKLPDDVIAFLSTSRNKEGINIKNDDIHVMFIESHAALDIVQMAGRLRNPADKLYIIVDSRGHLNAEHPYDCSLAHEPEILEGINKNFRKLCEQEDYRLNEPEGLHQKPAYAIPALRKHIDKIHAQYPYYRFDYFTRQYMFYDEHEAGRRYYAVQNRRFEEAMQSMYDLGNWMQKIYPGVPYIVSDKIEFCEDIQAKVDAYLRDNKLLNVTLRNEDRKKIQTELEAMLQKRIGKLKSFLKHHGYTILNDTRSKNDNAPIRIVKIPSKLAA